MARILQCPGSTPAKQDFDKSGKMLEGQGLGFRVLVCFCPLRALLQLLLVAEFPTERSHCDLSLQA